MRVGMLVLNIPVAYSLMHEYEFTPRKDTSVARDMLAVLKSSLQHGLKNSPIRWVMLVEFFAFGVGYYAFYAMPSCMLGFYGSEKSYAITGMAAAIYGGAMDPGWLCLMSAGFTRAE